VVERVELERVAGCIRNRSVNVDLWAESPCRERSSLTPEIAFEYTLELY